MRHVRGTVKASVPRGLQTPAKSKEQHFFDTDDRFKQGFAFYVQPYPACRAGGGQRRYAIDATPRYLRSPTAAARVHATYAEHTRALRIIVIVRNPTDRFRSWFDMFASTTIKLRFTTLDQFVNDTLTRLKSCVDENHLSPTSGKLWPKCLDLGAPFDDALVGGLYAPQLAAWLRWFPARQIALVTLAGYVKSAEKVLRDLAAFMGQAQQLGPPVVHRRKLAMRASHVNTYKPHILGDRARGALDKFYEPHVAGFVALLHSPVAEGMRSTPFSPVAALTARALVAGTM
jgi:hypothetical protein